MKIIKCILPYLLLAVLILPSVGVLVYMHQCNYSGKVSINLESTSCCSDELQSGHVCCTIHNLKNSGFDIVSATPCCDDSNIYLKLTDHLITERLSVSNPTPAILVDLLNPVIYSDLVIQLHRTAYNNHSGSPPEEDLYLDISSLRL